MLQCVEVCCNGRKNTFCAHHLLDVLHCVALCCTVLHCVALCCTVLRCVALCCGVLQCVTVRCSVSQCFAAAGRTPSARTICSVRCSVLQCVAVCCSGRKNTFCAHHLLGAPFRTHQVLCLDLFVRERMEDQRAYAGGDGRVSVRVLVGVCVYTHIHIYIYVYIYMRIRGQDVCSQSTIEKGWKHKRHPAKCV